MNWGNICVSIYNNHLDNKGQLMTLREILLTQVAMPHYVWAGHLEKQIRVIDIETIMQLRALDRTSPDFERKKSELKSLLHAFTPAGLLESKAKGKVKEIYRSGLLQLDFDYKGINEYDIEDLKKAVFDLPFICFCGLSASGDGFYALARIAEPEKLLEYAEHIFEVLKEEGIQPDESKGKKVENLRYLSYDCNMLIKDNPVPLKVRRFRRKENPNQDFHFASNRQNGNGDGLINSQLELLRRSAKGERFNTVRKVAFTLGGLGNSSILDLIKNEIANNPVFAGEISSFLKTAEDVFKAGMKKPLV